ALLETSVQGWRAIALAPSYAAFLKLAQGVPVDWRAKDRGGAPQPGRLLAAADRLLGDGPVGLVAVGMPVATVAVNGRRAADDAISREFGALGCAVHSPTKDRPGAVGRALTQGFRAAGFEIATAEAPRGTAPRLLEVYPHPALVLLLNADYRVAYKVARTRKYWPDKPAGERASLLLEQFARILAALSAEIDGIALPLPAPGRVESLAGLKPFEDAIDALVCAWVGIRYLAGHARAYGDATAAVWVPQPTGRVASASQAAVLRSTSGVSASRTRA
ncbi:MAG: DUF429 domain-containing protein, partial [Alphaproteobacteria bacterium]